MKLFPVFVIFFIIIFNNYSFSQEMTIGKKAETNKELSSSLLFKPYFDILVGSKAGYFIFKDDFSKYLENTVPIYLYMQFNPSLINNFYSEVEIGYLNSSLKFDSKGTYKILTGSLNLIYQIPVGWFNPYAVCGGGVLYRILKTDYISDNEKNYMENLIQGGAGIRLDLDYNYLFDLRSTYKMSYGDKIKSYGLDFTLGVGYAFNGGPENRIEKYVDISNNFSGIYPAMMNRYSTNSIGTVTITNKLKNDMLNVRVSIENADYLKKQTDLTDVIQRIPAGAIKNIPIKALLNEYSLKNHEDRIDTFYIKIKCKLNGLDEELIFSKSVSLPIYKRNAINWENTKYIGSFITLNDKVIDNFARNAVVASENIETPNVLIPNLKKALALYYALCEHKLLYVSDPSGITSTDKKKAVVDKIQFPREFLASKTGDCDDFTALYASLLENIGIRTAIITVPGHILLAFDTGVKPFNKDILLSGFDNLITTSDDTTWIAVETTLIGSKKSFINAMNSGYSIYKQKQNIAEFINTSECMKEFPPAFLPIDDKVYNVQISSNFTSDMEEFSKLASKYAKKNKNKNPLMSARIYAELGKTDKAIKLYKQYENSSDSEIKINVLLGMGYVYIQKEKYNKALKNFKKALTIDNSNTEAIYSICLLHQIMQNKEELDKYIKLLPEDFQKDFQ